MQSDAVAAERFRIVISWYLDPDGGTSVLWPSHTGAFRKALRHFDPADYQFVDAPAPAPAAVA